VPDGLKLLEQGGDKKFLELVAVSRQVPMAADSNHDGYGRQAIGSQASVLF
jgi:hypothetical protein